MSHAPIEKIKLNASKVIAVASGKGGVGKSTVAVNIALALQAKGNRIGLLDADIYGPNIPLMLGLESAAAGIKDNKIIPVEKHGIKIMSAAFIAPPEQALIWRGPLANKLIEQFLGDVEWGDLDFLIIDLPPGTGDVPLSIIQKAELDGGIVVTTPQEASVADVRKMINMFEITETSILGIVENMKYLVCTECGKKVILYPNSDQRSISEILGYEQLAELPFEPRIGQKSEEGSPYFLNHQSENSQTVKEYLSLADKIVGSGTTT